MSTPREDQPRKMHYKRKDLSTSDSSLAEAGRPAKKARRSAVRSTATKPYVFGNKLYKNFFKAPKNFAKPLKRHRSDDEEADEKNGDEKNGDEKKDDDKDNEASYDATEEDEDGFRIPDLFDTDRSIRYLDDPAEDHEYCGICSAYEKEIDRVDAMVPVDIWHYEDVWNRFEAHIKMHGDRPECVGSGGNDEGVHTERPAQMERSVQTKRGVPTKRSAEGDGRLRYMSLAEFERGELDAA